MAGNALPTALLTTTACVTAGRILPHELGGKGELPEARMYLGIAVTFFFLSVLDEFAPEVAQPLSIAVAGTAFAIYGTPLISSSLGIKKDKE